jgi:hypothetical protein
MVADRLIPIRDLCESPLTCHSEGAERPKNLINTRKYEILRSAQDDKKVFRRGLICISDSSMPIALLHFLTRLLVVRAAARVIFPRPPGRRLRLAVLWHDDDARQGALGHILGLF